MHAVSYIVCTTADASHLTCGVCHPCTCARRATEAPCCIDTFECQDKLVVFEAPVQ